MDYLFFWWQTVTDGGCGGGFFRVSSANVLVYQCVNGKGVLAEMSVSNFLNQTFEEFLGW